MGWSDPAPAWPDTTPVRKVLRSLLYVVYVIGFVIAVDYFFFWRPFVSGLRETERPETFDMGALAGVSAETMRLIGGIGSDRKSSFIHFDETKPEGTLRACAFGDSFTYGDEVRRGADFPSLLGRQFKRADLPVEVINFGSSWHGFHQAFILWERVGRRYGCDYALLGPGAFFEERDTAFNHTDLLSPYFLHARYVLDGGGVRLVRVLGDGFGDRFDGYWSFIPRWRYLRYDRNPPPFLRAAIPRGRTLANPFYYRRDSPEAEAAAIWRALLGTMVESGMPVILSNIRDDILALARSLDTSPFPVMAAWKEHRFPYRAPQGHNSVWGNQLIARQYFSELVDAAPRTAQRLITRGRGDEAHLVRVPERRLLSEFASLSVQIDDRDVGLFVTASKHFSSRGKGRRSALYDTNFRSLLAIVAPGESLVDAAFVPLRFDLESGAELRLQMERAGKGAPRLLARVRILHQKLPIGVAETGTLEFREKDELVLGRDARPLPSRRDAMQLLLEGVPLFESTVEGGEVAFRTVHSSVLQITAGESRPVDVEAMPDAGVVQLVFAHPEDGPLRIPIARWEKVPVRLPESSTPLAQRIPPRF